MTGCFEKQKASKSQLQQSQISLQNELLEKERQIKQLEEQLQGTHSSVSTVLQETHPKQREEVRES